MQLRVVQILPKLGIFNCKLCILNHPHIRTSIYNPNQMPLLVHDRKQKHIPYLEQLLCGVMHNANATFTRSSLFTFCTEGNDMTEMNPIKAVTCGTHNPKESVALNPPQCTQVKEH